MWGFFVLRIILSLYLEISLYFLKLNFDQFLSIMKKADGLTKWSPDKKILFDELRKFVNLDHESSFYIDFFWESIVNSVEPDPEANKHLEKLNNINFPWGK